MPPSNLRTGATIVRVNITGLPQLRARLGALPLKVQRAITRKACRDAAKVLQADAKRTAPVRTGALKSGIKVRSIYSLPGKKFKRSPWFTGISVMSTFPKTFYARFQEFGAPKIHLTQVKFMRNAFNFSGPFAVIGFVQRVAQYINIAARGGTP